MKKQIKTDKAPKSIGPYSQAIMVDGFVFTSGQIPINPKTGSMVEKDIEKQTIQVMKNLKEILAYAGYKFDNVIKTTIFLSDMKYFEKVNQIYKKYFLSNPPARSCIEVSKLPKDSLLEIELIAK
ncbi:RidA family protein [Halocella sp. SP3-1]|uniref:RidA family protein n=1 Tax=Halocella sp. SP3-1 TaxID=2382161 RepID=UPI000F763046|nr:RidA family protein [Halocella sp. SP3-1]AZO95184.1 RidA family protein [Halocella sp. SP3-1]